VVNCRRGSGETKANVPAEYGDVVVALDEIILNFVNAVILSLMRVFSEQWVRRRKKKILRNRLAKDGWKWRRFESLRRAIRDDEDSTRELLFEVGARASTKSKDLWTLDD